MELLHQLETSEKLNRDEAHGGEVKSAAALMRQIARVGVGKVGVGNGKHARSRYHVICKLYPWICRRLQTLDASYWSVP